MVFGRLARLKELLESGLIYRFIKYEGGVITSTTLEKPQEPQFKFKTVSKNPVILKSMKVIISTQFKIDGELEIVLNGRSALRASGTDLNLIVNEIINFPLVNLLLDPNESIEVFVWGGNGTLQFTFELGEL